MLYRRYRDNRRNTRCLIGTWFILITCFCINIGNIQYSIYHSLGMNTTFESDIKILNGMGSRDTVLMVKPNESTTYIQPEHFNLLLKDGTKPDIVIMVTSLADEDAEEKRNLIRQTWKQWSDNFSIRTLFFIGLPRSQSSAERIKKLKEENKEHEDLIVDDFEEGYYKLSAKVLRMMKWFLMEYLRNNNNPPTYFVKTDHDVFINIPNLVTYLNSVELSSIAPIPTTTLSPNISSESNSLIDNNRYYYYYYIGGQKFEDAPLELNWNSKFYISPDYWLEGNKFFPTYVPGPCYILSSNALEAIYRQSFSVPLFPFEDVYITGIIASSVLNLTISDIPKISTKPENVMVILEDDMRTREAIALHPVKSSQLMSSIYSRVIASVTSSD